MNGGPSGFNNAQVTKALAIICFTFSAFIGIRGSSSSIGLTYKDFFENPRILRMIASLFTFSSTPELMFGLYLLYYFRLFERQIGSNKYSVFIFFSMAVSFLLQFLTLAYFRDATVTALSPGPYAVIFASFVPFFFDIPVSTTFRVSSIKFSDKTFIYLAGFQLFLSSWKRSMAPALCGLVAGALYRMNLLNIRKAKLPEWVSSLISRLSWPNSGSPRATSSVSQHARAGQRTQMAQSMVPPEDSIGTLVAMGFDRNSAREALVHARNDISVATNILLEAQAHQ